MKRLSALFIINKVITRNILAKVIELENRYSIESNILSERLVSIVGREEDVPYILN